MHSKFSATSLLLVLFSLLANLSLHAEPFQPYQEQHTFTLSDTREQSRSMKDFAGKVLLVNFWATWCTPCIYELPELAQLEKDMAGKPFSIITINVGENKNRVTQFTQSMKFTLPVLLDVSNKVFKNWNVVTLPASYLIDAEGQIRFRARGNPGWDQQPTYDVIEKLISEAGNS